MVHDDIPWIAITGMRNRLVHAYFVIDATSMELVSMLESLGGET